MVKPSIIIIGAGATGLIAATKLSPGFNVTILEAQSRVGGRLQSILASGEVIEAGAEFVHGTLPVTLGLLKKAGIPYVKVEGEMYRKKNGRFVNAEEMTEGWDELLEHMAAATQDMTLQDLLQNHYDAPEYELLRKHVKSYAEGFDLADIKSASIKALFKEWSAEGDANYRIPTGYSALATYLQKIAEQLNVTIHTGTIIQKVRWQKGAVMVQAYNGEKYWADKLLVTVPVSLLQQPALKPYINFVPHIHFNENVAKKIGFGSVIKIIVRFRNAFWQKDAGFILSDELIPTWWTQLPDKSSVLTGWLGGPGAEAISHEPDEVIVKKALISLANIYELPVAQLEQDLEQSMVFNWHNNEFARGGYSYSTLHSDAAKEIISTPVEGTIFFAGEALYTGDHPGTVEAALVSGIKTANMINEIKGI